jgi:hypothetical protein
MQVKIRREHKLLHIIRMNEGISAKEGLHKNLKTGQTTEPISTNVQRPSPSNMSDINQILAEDGHFSLKHNFDNKSLSTKQGLSRGITKKMGIYLIAVVICNRGNLLANFFHPHQWLKKPYIKSVLESNRCPASIRC